MLSPKHAPPAIAAVVRRIFPPTIWLSHKKIGAQAANVPQLVPVAIDNIDVTIAPTRATVFPVIPRVNAILMIDAPTPVAINTSAIAYAAIRINNAIVISLTFVIAASKTCEKFFFSVHIATAAATIVANGAAIKASNPLIISAAKTNTGTNLIIAIIPIFASG